MTSSHAATLVIASGNAGKVSEIAEILADSPWRVRAQAEWDVPEAVEDGLTFVENALKKARNAAAHTGLPALGDDSGLVVDALDGRPGLMSARYAAGGGGDQARANIDKLLDELDGVPESQRTAHFYCVMVVVHHATDPAPLIATGRWDGRIVKSPRGGGGFGYDPVFFDPEHGCTAAELAPEVKNSISHRGKALHGMGEMLRRDFAG